MIEYILLPALVIIGIAWLMGAFGDDKTTFYNEDGSEYKHEDPQGRLDWRFWAFMIFCVAMLFIIP